MTELAGKVAIVTGAAQGVGECIARTLAADGASLLLADIQREKLESVATSLRSHGARVESAVVDISEPEQTDQMTEVATRAFGRIDALVNNAAIDAPPGLAWEIDADHWRRVIEVNLSGAWWCTRSVLPHMMERGTGKIVTISSISARMATPETSPAYSAAKAGLIGMTISLSVQLEPHGILVNAITPGATGTTGNPMPEDQRKLYDVVFPLGLGGAQPISDAVLFLLRSSGDWISGAVLNISGGSIRGV